MKTVNIVTSYFFPEKSAGANRVNSIVKELSNENIVNVIYLVERGKELDLKLTKSQFNAHVNLHPILQKKFKNDRFLERCFYEILYSLKLNLKNIFIKSDVTIVSIPYLMLLPISALFILFYKRKTILDIRDLIWLYLDFSEKKYLQKAKVILEKICIWSANIFDVLVTTTKSQLDYFNKNGFIIENGIEKTKFYQLSNIQYPKIESKIYITYAGTIGFPQNLMTFVEAANILQHYDSRYVFNLVGKGSDLKRILKYIDQNKLINVNYFGELDWQSLKKIYANSHILYAQLKDKNSFRTAQPSKIFEYASTGFPIIFAGIGESERVIKMFKNSVCIIPERAQLLANEILKIDCSKSYETIQIVFDNFIREDIMEKYKMIV